MNFAHCATELSLHTEEDSEDRVLFWDLDCGSCLDCGYCLAVAVSVAGSCSSDWTPSLGTSNKPWVCPKKKGHERCRPRDTQRGNGHMKMEAEIRAMQMSIKQV